MQERHVGMRCPLNSKGQRSNAFSHLIAKTLHPSHLCWRYWMLINSKSVTWRERVTYERVQFKIWPQKKSGVRSKWKNEKWKTVSSKEKPVNGGNAICDVVFGYDIEYVEAYTVVLAMLCVRYKPFICVDQTSHWVRLLSTCSRHDWQEAFYDVWLI